MTEILSSEEIAELKEEIEMLESRGEALGSMRLIQSLLATLDQRTKERDEAKDSLRELQHGLNPTIHELIKERDELKRRVEELKYDSKLAQSRRNVIRASNKENNKLKEENAKLREGLSDAELYLEGFNAGRKQTNPTPQ